MKKLSKFMVLMAIGAALAAALHLPARLETARSADALLARFQPESEKPATSDKTNPDKKDASVKTTPLKHRLAQRSRAPGTT